MCPRHLDFLPVEAPPGGRPLRVLGVGHHGDLADLHLRLAARGHDVRVHIADPDSSDVLAGMVPRVERWESDLERVGRGRGGLILFEGTGWGDVQDRLRREGYRVVGGSGVGDRLELDRAFGQSSLAAAGLHTAKSWEHDGFDEAIAWLEEHRGHYVLKFSGGGFASTRSYVGVLPDGADLLAVLRFQRRRWTLPERPRVVLMEHVQGVEVGVGAFFNGERFVSPANLDWEHKRFFPGNLGELTGEMGTVVAYRGAARLFDATLAKLAPTLRRSGYVGYVNLNQIVNERGAFPLELTCRFGYPGFAILGALHVEPWDVVLERLLEGEETIATHEGFAVGVVLTVPPFPYTDGYERLSKGMPIGFRADLTSEDRAHIHFGEIGRDGDELVTAGQIGYVMVVTGRGPSVSEARAAAHARIGKVILPNVRYRNDIGATFDEDRANLVRWGWLDG